MIALYDEDITYYGRDRTTAAKSSDNMAEVAKGMLGFPSRSLVEEKLDVDIWR